MKRIGKFAVGVVLLLLVIGIAGICLGLQPNSRVIDRTEDSPQKEPEDPAGGSGGEAKEPEEPLSGDGDGTENELIISSGVKLFVDDAAKEVNQAIQRIYCNDADQMEITLDPDSNEDFLSMNKGDIFFLEGDEDTPFGCTYIGKVVSLYARSNESTILLSETPGIDEVFDSVKLDVLSSLDEESLISVSGMDGVNITYTEDVSGAYAAIPSVTDEELPSEMMGAQHQEGTTGPMTYSRENSGAVLLSSADPGSDETSGEIRINPGGFVLEYNLDLLQVVKTVKTALSDPDSLFDGEPSDRNTADELLGGKVVNDLIESFNDDPKVQLKGKTAISDLSLNIACDWNIADLTSKCGGFTTLAYGLGYQYMTEDSLTIQAKNMEFGGTKNEFQCGELIKLAGLRDKLIPLGFVQWTPAGVVPLISAMDPNQMNNLIHINASMSPLSAAVIFYLDMSGKVSASLVMNFDYQQNFYGGCEFVRDGQWVGESFQTKDDSTSWSVDFQIAADMDAHMGIALDVYLFNVSIIDVNAVEYGLEGEGEGGIRIDSAHKDSPEVYLDWYARGYLKVLDTHINFRGLVTVGSMKLSAGFSRDWVLLDITHWTAGTKKETNYDANTMSFGQVTAEDEEAIYYLTESGKILKQDRVTGECTVLYSGEMVRFCGIDASYLYLLSSGDTYYDIYRVDKKTGISRRIQTEVAAALAEDRESIYYLSALDESTIMALDRESLHTKAFQTFQGNSVQLMLPYEDQFYVTTKEDGGFFFFTLTYNYYLLNRDGTVKEELGSDPDALRLPRTAMPSYYYSARYIERGMLRRASAEKFFWISADQSTVIEAEQASGWLDKDEGIFVTLKNENTTGPGYTIWLYQAADGQKREITDVYSDAAYFTLCKDTAGFWYYFDEDENYLTLYRMDSDFSRKEVVTQYLKNAVKASLSECSMEIVGNKMIFYTMNDNLARVLYRYDVY